MPADPQTADVIDPAGDLRYEQAFRLGIAARKSGTPRGCRPDADAATEDGWLDGWEDGDGDK